MLNVIEDGVKHSDKIVNDLPENIRLVDSTRNQPKIRVDIERLLRAQEK